MSADPEEINRWFSAEVLPHEAALRAWLRGQFPQLTDVDDIVQESFARVLRARGRGEVQTPRALLFTTARHVAIDLLRRNKIVAFEPLTESPASPVYDEGRGVAESAARFSIQSIPAMFLFDRDGRLVSTNARGEKLEPEVKRLLGL